MAVLKNMLLCKSFTERKDSNAYSYCIIGNLPCCAAVWASCSSLIKVDAFSQISHK